MVGVLDILDLLSPLTLPKMVRKNQTKFSHNQPMELYRMAYSLKIVGEFRRTPCVIFGRDVQFLAKATASDVDPRPPNFFLRYSTHPDLGPSPQPLFDPTFPLRVISI